MIKDLISSVTSVAGVADKFTESAQERAKTLDGRHATDMAGDNWLSKSVRPLTLVVLMALQVLIVLLSAFGLEISETIIIQHGILLSGAFGFYFNSRKAEKISARNAVANIQMEKLKVRHIVRSERKELNAGRRLARRVAKAQDKEGQNDD